MAIRLKGLDHIVIRTENVARLQAFYCDVLGCTVARVAEKIGLTQLRAGVSLIDLVDTAGSLGVKGGPPPGNGALNMDHFCLQVADWDEEALRAHLAKHNVMAGETEQRFGAEGSGPSIYLEDPDGNTVELKGPANRDQ